MVTPFSGKDYVIKLGDELNVSSGYAKQILGYEQDYIGVVWPVGATGPSTQFSDLQTGIIATWVASDALFVSGQEVQMKYSIFRYAEHRLRAEVDADLAIPNNILIENGVQKMHYNIASFALPQKYEGRITVDSNPLVTERISHVSHLFAGNTIIKAKETPTTDWYTLQSAANVQNMRLHIFVVRREWNVNKKTWELVRNKLTMDDGLGKQTRLDLDPNAKICTNVLSAYFGLPFLKGKRMTTVANRKFAEMKQLGIPANRIE